MNRALLTCTLLLAAIAAFGQTPVKKIRVILVGTFHFNQSLDSSSRLHSNLFSAQRQKEVDALVASFVKQRPDKIFLEFTEKKQPFYDSVYARYLTGIEPETVSVKANEIFQLGMKTAKLLGHKKVIGMNYQPQELAASDYVPRNRADSAIRDLYMALTTFEDSTRTNARFFDLRFPQRMPNIDSLLQRTTLTQFLSHLNSPQKLMRDEYVNWNYLYSMGTGSDMTMTDYVGTFWYGTNLRNFVNVLRQADYQKDNCYLVIYGSSHIPILSYFFRMHPYFEVVEFDQVTK